MDTSDLVLQFCNITSADPVKAESYLQVSDYDVERAIELYFESGGVDLSGPAPTHPPPEPPSQTTSLPQVIDVDEMPDLVATPGPTGPTIEDDEAFARRLMQEDVDLSAPAGSTSNNDGVRSPIRARNDILVHPDEDYDAPYSYARRGRGGGASRGIFNQTAPSIWNADDPLQSLAESTGGSSEASDKASRLAQMYRRPFEIMKNVSLDEARDEVRAEEPMKWIMVNIMNSQEFACQILNRDLWSDSEVQKTIRENFFFLQFTHDEPEGVRYQQRYPFDHHPHIGIIDPRTGEQVKTWDKILTPAEFIFEMHEFLERFSLSEEARNPLGRKTKVTKDISMMSEEEQMAAALAASLGKDPLVQEPETTTRPVTAQGSTQPDTADEKTVPVETPSTSQKSPTLFSSIAASDTPEPAQSPQTTRIQFRFPEGGRPLVRRFNKTDTIRDIFAFVKCLRSSSEEFELVFVGRRLLAEAEESGQGSLDKGIVEAGLANGSLTVEV